LLVYFIISLSYIKEAWPLAKWMNFVEFYTLCNWEYLLLGSGLDQNWSYQGILFLWWSSSIGLSFSLGLERVWRPFYFIPFLFLPLLCFNLVPICVCVKFCIFLIYNSNTHFPSSIFPIESQEFKDPKLSSILHNFLKDMLSLQQMVLIKW
jgi:hypothetical protein